MKDEIKESVNRIQSIVDFYKLNDENNYDYSDDVLISMKVLLDYITNLQEELKSANESITWWHNRFNAVEKNNNRLQQENQDIKDTLQDKLDYIGHLKELCVKYEEEHKTKFNEWVFDKRENERLTQGVTLLTNKLIDMTKEKEDYKLRNKKAIEYNKNNIKSKTLNDILQEGE